MPYASNHGTKVYYEVEGKGFPLIIHHGLSGCLDNWRENGYVDALKDDCKVILMDARGHGKSDKPHDPALYGGDAYAGDVSAIMDDLGLPAANFFGYSFGGGVAFELAKRIPGRLISLICGGCGARLPGKEMLEGQIAFYGAGPEAMLKAYEQGGPMPSFMKEHILANDSRAMVAICRSMMAEKSLLEDLSQMKMPFLIFAGDKDFTYTGAKESADLLPNAIFISLAGLDHYMAGGSPGLIVPQIKEFLKSANNR
jgi:pimeloyl-ACP methyl ester carboxylesterase